MKKQSFYLLLICITLLIGCSREETFDDFFHKTMEEKNKGEEEYSLIHKEFNIVHENDAIAIFMENRNQQENIFIGYYEKENGNWNWRKTRGTRWEGPIKWVSMNEVPYIYFGTIDDSNVSEVYVGKKAATIIKVEDKKRVWYAISDVKDRQVKVVKNDGTQEMVEQTEGDNWIKKDY
ncbi:hypothetical protein [Dethiothermospora halolimnae]|uniref:hypothetical protein n=1 Tax=Dethiothermospora halolimnae TaxID=3114390 RepID=UPI003CCBAC30